ncbi:caspase domain-containing protein [Mycena rosella]|uniref:Caspase domain-containing protein n=1 Tax=Mycena rosella TaxID=1033263 RepID=A0AAD7H2M7_MYCRO|nr:caspase domain-containing protein [Mycena rosella]
MISQGPTVSKYSEASSSRLCRESKKKALLIGINSLSSPSADYGLLQGPHQDVVQMKNLLVQTYGYRDEDIQVLMDDGITGHVQPDRRNIVGSCINSSFYELLTWHLQMLSIRNLVTDTHKGDKLFFHYCGHTIQVPSRSNTEEDGLDECLVPLDGEERMITDNTSSICDVTASSFPGCRRESERATRCGTEWSAAWPYQWNPRRVPQDPAQFISHHEPPRLVPVLSPRLSPRSPLNGFRPTPWNSPAILPEDDTESGKRLARQVSGSRARAVSRKSHVPAPLKLWESNKENLHVDSVLTTGGDSQSWYTPDSLVSSALPSTMVFCESPEAAYCHGWCRATDDNGLLPGAKDPGRQLADVISLGSCKDSELSWENEDGMSMTRALIHVLSDDPHPTLRDLVTQISHTLHGLTRERHLQAKVWKKYWDAHGIKSSGIGSFDTDSFQNPQIASHRPLDMDARWNI